MTATPRAIAQDIGLFLVLALFANLILATAIDGVSARALLWGFYLIVFVHIGATLYDGAFDRARTISWLVLILGWFLAECASFMNAVMPMGQFLFWLATNAPWTQPILEGLMSTPSIVPVVLLALLALDVFLAQRRRWRASSWPWLTALVVAAAIVGIALGVALPTLLPRPQPVSPLTFDILPSWHLLPYYAMLRAVSDKAAAVAVALLAVALPIFWPWMRAKTLYVGPLRWIWRLAWLAFVATFIGLGYLAAQPPEQTMVLATRVLTAYYFAFLLVIPLLLRPMAAPRMS